MISLWIMIWRHNYLCFYLCTFKLCFIATLVGLYPNMSSVTCMKWNTVAKVSCNCFNLLWPFRNISSENHTYIKLNQNTFFFKLSRYYIFFVKNLENKYKLTERNSRSIFFVCLCALFPLLQLLTRR